MRYVDDVGTTVNSRSDTNVLIIESKTQIIPFEMELPDDDGFLPILDLKVRITRTVKLSTSFSQNPPKKASS